MSLNQQDITSLIKLCQDNNHLAQLEIYNRYQNAMFNVSLRIVKDRALAEDVMQESFITAFSKLNSFKGTATFGAWLKRIVINNSLTAYKKAQRYTPLEKQAEVGIEDNDGVTDTMHHNEQMQQVLVAMKTLKDRYQQVLTLHYIEGFDTDEISEIFNITNATCRTLLSRAKESLRKKIQLQ
ncbi:RNA polymerase sigma factor [Patiriisocius marinus]|uniref:RNA polymerase sigma factor n=1 Tax=Patiriisocius marinus TaxID=1397112 RepID=A0A5J4J3E4_9FLAO|nr:sigma-70 family RNA polymerase sigma factor [Patiriisocius marinus]GER60558.1 RNA polymerase sigma factor [Patiriisocius marinus]